MHMLPTINLKHDVFLLRHGETECNHAGRIQGQLNSDLTALGRSQARRQGEILRDIRPQSGPLGHWASPLGRAQETARLAYETAPFASDPRIAEIYCGHWEGLTHSERLARDPDIVAAATTDFDVYANAPGGESINDLSSRLTAFLTELDRPAIIVSHKIALVVMRALLVRADKELCSDLAPRQGSVMRISQGEVVVHL